MELATLSTFVWQAIASGTIGNTAYDGLKAILGNGFGRLSGYVQTGQQQPFEIALQTLLETSDAIREQLARLASGSSTSGNISTGNIDAQGNVMLGHHNHMG